MKKIIIILIISLLIILGYGFWNTQKEEKQPVVSQEILEPEEKDEEEEEIPEPPKEDINIKFTAIGDIMCHNTQYNDAYDSKTGSYDFSYVFSDIKTYIDSADIAIGNLETTFAGKDKGYSSYPQFNTPEQLAMNLKNLGIDVVSTANNHCMDSRYTGLVSTLNYLDEAGISHTGTNRSIDEQNSILVKDVKGIKIAFLSFTYGTNGIPVPQDKSYAVNFIDKNLILEQIKLAKEQSPDLICVSMHWGIEYQTKQNSEQEDMANFLFQNGVNIILGSHPHVLQPMEKRDEGFVIYSLGNFMSGQTKPNTRDSIILNLDITKNGETGKVEINNVDYVPIYMYKQSNVSKQRYKILDIRQNNSLKDEEIKIKGILGM